MSRNLLLSVLGLGLVVLVAGLLMPARSEVVRSAELSAPPEVVHAWLEELPSGPTWCSWGPARQDGGVEVTASEPTGGLWLDVTNERRRKAAVLLEATPAGTRLAWHDVLHLRGDPFGRVAALDRERVVGAELEASLAQLQERADAAALSRDPAEPARDSTQVLVVLVDDVGWPLLREAPTPSIDALAAEGLTFTNLWAMPKCGPTRAALLTGRFPFRIGNGEIAKRHNARSMGLEELLLPEVIGPERSAAFGKWHLSHDPGHPNASGFGYYAGALGNLNGQRYDEWFKVTNGETSTTTKYATTDVTDEALQSDADFKYVAYHAAHTPFHEPPAELAPNAPRDGTEAGMLLAMAEALDTEVGRLLDAHPDAFVIFLTDNGTTAIVDGGKGTMREDGINVPMIVRGPGVPRGATTDALVNVVDVFATVAELFEIEATAEDSISFAPVLRGEPGERDWNYSCLFFAPTPGRRTHAVRDADHKLVIQYDRSVEMYQMPGEVELDPRAMSDQVRTRFDLLRARIPAR